MQRWGELSGRRLQGIKGTGRSGISPPAQAPCGCECLLHSDLYEQVRPGSGGLADPTPSYSVLESLSETLPNCIFKALTPHTELCSGSRAGPMVEESRRRLGFRPGACSLPPNPSLPLTAPHPRQAGQGPQRPDLNLRPSTQELTALHIS